MTNSPEFIFDNSDLLEDIINLLESNNFIIKVYANEYWDGFFQLKSDVKSDDIKHQSISDENGDQIIDIKEINGQPLHYD